MASAAPNQRISEGLHDFERAESSSRSRGAGGPDRVRHIRKPRMDNCRWRRRSTGISRQFLKRWLPRPCPRQLGSGTISEPFSP